MSTRRVELRMKAELADWVGSYATERGASRTAVIEAALRSFREDCARGVPDLSGGAVKVAGRPGAPVVPAPGPPAGASVSVPAVPDRLQVGFSRAEAFRGRRG